MIIDDSSLLCIYDMLEGVIIVNCLTRFINFILVYRDPWLQRFVTGKIFSGTHIHNHELETLSCQVKMLADANSFCEPVHAILVLIVYASKEDSETLLLEPSLLACTKYEF